MLEMKEFTKVNYYEYGGAEVFDDGSLPLIGQYDESITIVADNQMIETKIFNKHFILNMKSNKNYKTKICTRILNNCLEGFTPKEIEKKLKDMGFVLAFEEDE